MTAISKTRIDKTHPALEGHFPGHPIVPGVVMLQFVIDTIKQQIDGRPDVYLNVVKFLKPIYPEETIEIKFAENTRGHYDFTCYRGEDHVITGTFVRESNQRGKI